MEDSPRGDNGEPSKKKRRRIVISCTECHRRKQKCDRLFPCSNCAARNKQSFCRYENEAARKEQLLEEANAMSEKGLLSNVKPDGSAQVAALGYAKPTGWSNTTLGLYNSIESHGTGSTDLAIDQQPAMAEYNGLQERYKSLVRQLPTKSHIEKLLITFFESYNTQYYPLDEGIFWDLLKKWKGLPFLSLNRGPQELDPDLQFFPALLFQMLAVALQYQPLDYDPGLDNLKYAAGMTLDDLATDYSESGVSIMSLLGKRNITLITVQAGFLRCSYLKNCGLITESYHSLSQTIRDAQEIDLHIPNTDTESRSPEKAFEDAWIEQLRRRVWVLLTVWDVRIASTLGRPTTIGSRDPRYPFPIDAPVPKDRQAVAPAPRVNPSDPPTPLTVLLWNAELASPLWDISLLEKEGSHPSDFSKVERMHRLLNHVNKACPAYFRSHNPDTSFDSHPNCEWLPRTRANLQSLAAFNVMVLHRPYIFTQASSRTAALKAALDILRSQRSLFELIDVKDYKTHSLVLGTFDAVILAAAIYILYPFENPYDLDESLQHFEWGMERIETIAFRNSLAKSALNILKAVYVRLKKAVSPVTSRSQPFPTPSETPPSTKPDLSPQDSSVLRSAKESSYPPPPTGNGSSASIPYNIPAMSASSKSLQDVEAVTSWDTYPSSQAPLQQVYNPTLPNFDLAAMATLQPLHDLLYNDLSTLANGYAQNPTQDLASGRSWGDVPPTVPSNAQAQDTSAAEWQFEGDFGSDSFWGFMNQYNPR